MNEDARTYLYKRDIPQLFEVGGRTSSRAWRPFRTQKFKVTTCVTSQSLMTGLMYSRPEDPVKYLQNCLARVQDHNLASTIHWSSFLPDPADPFKPAFSGASQPLPPIQSSKNVQDDVKVLVDQPVVSPETRCLHPSTPLPPIGASSSSDLQKKRSDEEKHGASVVFVLGRCYYSIYGIISRSSANHLTRTEFADPLTYIGCLPIDSPLTLIS